MLRGKIVVENDAFLGNLKDGQFLTRKVPEEIRNRPAVWAAIAKATPTPCRPRYGRTLTRPRRFPIPVIPRIFHRLSERCVTRRVPRMVPLAQAMRRLRHTTTRNRLYDTTNQRRRAVEPTSIWAVL